LSCDRPGEASTSMGKSKTWDIVGGADKGGIIVRKGESVKSEQLLDRLSTGASVEEIELKGERLHYRRITGNGPDEGWVSIKLSGKDLAVRALTPEDKERRARWATWPAMSKAEWDKFPKAGVGERPKNMPEFKKVVNEQAPGEFWGLDFPFSPSQLKEFGPAWLTKAMHKTGSLPSDNEVTAFTSFDVKAGETTAETATDDANWGGAGCKVLLTVEYKRDPTAEEPGRELFAKMPHAYTGKNERYKLSVTATGDWPETMFYNLLAGKLPIRTPRIYFADMNRRTTNFIWIMERIAYGTDWEKSYEPGQVLPPPGKYRDWTLKNCADLYYAHARSMARFFGWYYHTKDITDQVDRCFMEEGSLSWRRGLFAKIEPLNQKQRDEFFIGSLSEPSLKQAVESSLFPTEIAQGFLQLGETFIRETAPHAFPAKYVSKDHLDRFFAEARELSHYGREMSWYTSLFPEYFSLAHPNAQVDNAFYWRSDGEMQCGLLDWGSTLHMSMPQCLAGGWMGAEPEFMDEHEEKLIDAFLKEYEEVTGAKLDRYQFYLVFKLSQGFMLFGCFANVQWCLRLIDKPGWKLVKDRFDKRIDATFLLRCYFVQIEFFLGMWMKRSPYPYWQKWMSQVGLKKK